MLTEKLARFAGRGRVEMARSMCTIRDLSRSVSAALFVRNGRQRNGWITGRKHTCSHITPEGRLGAFCTLAAVALEQVLGEAISCRSRNQPSDKSLAQLGSHPDRGPECARVHEMLSVSRAAGLSAEV